MTQERVDIVMPTSKRWTDWGHRWLHDTCKLVKWLCGWGNALNLNLSLPHQLWASLPSSRGLRFFPQLLYTELWVQQVLFMKALIFKIATGPRSSLEVITQACSKEKAEGVYQGHLNCKGPSKCSLVEVTRKMSPTTCFFHRLVKSYFFNFRLLSIWALSPSRRRVELEKGPTGWEQNFSELENHKPFARWTLLQWLLFGI